MNLNSKYAEILWCWIWQINGPLSYSDYSNEIWVKLEKLKEISEKLECYEFRDNIYITFFDFKISLRCLKVTLNFLWEEEFETVTWIEWHNALSLYNELLEIERKFNQDENKI
jgi:hypothetical protein